MKLALLQFFEMVRIPGGRLTGGEETADATESTFRAEDGWELHEVSPGRFTIRAAHMPVAYTLGACEFGFFPFVEPVVEMPPKYGPEPRGKRR